MNSSSKQETLNININFSCTHPIVRIIINLATVCTLTLFIVSLFSPLFTLEKFYFFDNTVSLITALMELLDKREIILFLVILLFSIVFPIFKLLLTLYLWNTTCGQLAQKWVHFIHEYGKWSMLDVFVVALMVVSIKLQALANMQIHYGFYLFFISVMASLVISAVSTKYINAIETAEII